MQKIKAAAEDFLAYKRVAVTGMSRAAEDHGANFVFKRMRDRGYEVLPVNPNAEEVEGARRATPTCARFRAASRRL